MLLCVAAFAEYVSASWVVTFPSLNSTTTRGIQSVESGSGSVNALKACKIAHDFPKSHTTFRVRVGFSAQHGKPCLTRKNDAVRLICYYLAWLPDNRADACGQMCSQFSHDPNIVAVADFAPFQRPQANLVHFVIEIGEVLVHLVSLRN